MNIDWLVLVSLLLLSICLRLFPLPICFRFYRDSCSVICFVVFFSFLFRFSSLFCFRLFFCSLLLFQNEKSKKNKKKMNKKIKMKKWNVIIQWSPALFRARSYALSVSPTLSHSIELFLIVVGCCFTDDVVVVAVVVVVNPWMLYSQHYSLIFRQDFNTIWQISITDWTTVESLLNIIATLSQLNSIPKMFDFNRFSMNSLKTRQQFSIFFASLSCRLWSRFSSKSRTLVFTYRLHELWNINPC